MAMRLRLPRPEDFASGLRSPAVSSRVGLWLGVCFLLAFLTGVYSHEAQSSDPLIWLPTGPVWLYTVTQGVHVTAGAAAVPLLLVKLWSVFPRLFVRPPRAARELALHLVERASIGVLVASAIFQLATGLANSSQWYPWSFSFRETHNAVGWLAVGALLVHVAVKLPVVRAALAGEVDDRAPDLPSVAPRIDASVPSADDPVADGPTRSGGLSRRALLRTTWLASGLAAVTTAGAWVPQLRHVSVFAVRSGEGPGGVPINRTARAAGVVAAATADHFTLEVRAGTRVRRLARPDLEAMEQHTAVLPIACVEGWSATGEWSGIRVADLMALVGADPRADVRVGSLQRTGPFRSSLLPAAVVSQPDTLLALRLAGEPLSLDHGYPCRLIAPNRPGVLQTKWVTSLAVGM